MAARWQAADRSLPILELGVEHWSPAEDAPPADPGS